MYDVSASLFFYTFSLAIYRSKSFRSLRCGCICGHLFVHIFVVIVRICFCLLRSFSILMRNDILLKWIWYTNTLYYSSSLIYITEFFSQYFYYFGSVLLLYYTYILIFLYSWFLRGKPLMCFFFYFLYFHAWFDVFRFFPTFIVDVVIWFQRKSFDFRNIKTKI